MQSGDCGTIEAHVAFASLCVATQAMACRMAAAFCFLMYGRIARTEGSG